MQLIKDYTKKYLKRNIPQIKVGDIIKVYQKIKEGSKSRIQVFEGIIIKRHAGESLDATFTVRRISFGVGMEKTFPLHLPSIIKIEKIKSIKVKRAKLYYLRKLTEKQIRRRGELKAFESWEEPIAKEEEEKLKAQKELEAKAKAEEGKKKQTELEKKFTQAQEAKEANKSN